VGDFDVSQGFIGMKNWMECLIRTAYLWKEVKPLENAEERIEIDLM
jgi:hypothetical protein